MRLCLPSLDLADGLHVDCADRFARLDFLDVGLFALDEEGQILPGFTASCPYLLGPDFQAGIVWDSLCSEPISNGLSVEINGRALEFRSVPEDPAEGQLWLVADVSEWLRTDDLQVRVGELLRELGRPSPDEVLDFLDPALAKLSERFDRAVTLEVVGEPSGDIYPILDCLPPLVENAVVHGFGADSDEVVEVNVSFEEDDTFHSVGVSDRGRGFDIDELIRRSVHRGLLEHHQAEHLKPHECLALAFLAPEGVSEEPDQPSVKSLPRVKQKLDGMGGHVEVRTAPDRGTTVWLRIPKRAA